METNRKTETERKRQLIMHCKSRWKRRRKNNLNTIDGGLVVRMCKRRERDKRKAEISKRRKKRRRRKEKKEENKSNSIYQTQKNSRSTEAVNHFVQFMIGKRDERKRKIEIKESMGLFWNWFIFCLFVQMSSIKPAANTSKKPQIVPSIVSFIGIKPYMARPKLAKKYARNHRSTEGRGLMF